MSRSAESRIAEFLDAHPNQPLRVAVGYATWAGLAWIGRHTRDRPVELLIGDCRKHQIDKGTAEDRRAAREFLSRADVKVRNWYTRRGVSRLAHLKAWQTTDREGQPRLLAGSANLTQKGLQHHTETMGEYSGNDAIETIRSMDNLFARSWDAKERLLDYLDTSEEVPLPSGSRTTGATQATASARSMTDESANRRTGSSHRARRPTAARAGSSSSNRRPATSRSRQGGYAKRPVNRRRTRRRPSSRPRASAGSGFLKFWWGLPRRGREAVLSLLGVLVLIVGLLVWINAMDSNSDTSSNASQPISAQSAESRPSPPSTQLSPATNPPEPQRVDGVSCTTDTNYINLSDRPTSVITQTICASRNPDGTKTYWQCSEVRDWGCYGGQLDPCGTEFLGYPFSPVALQGIFIYNEPQPDCQGGFDSSEWGLPDSRQIVPASEAWRSGGFNWNAQQKQDFFIDPENTWEDGQPWPTVSDNSSTLLATALPETQCQLATRWVNIKKKYNLNADQAEVSILQAILRNGC